MPRKRPGRTRTLHTNNRTPLLLSTIAPQDINLRQGETWSIVCPDCHSWRRLMGTKRLVIREHCHSDRVADGETHERCPGSNQLVLLDQDTTEWGERLLAVDSTATGRRSARQHHKPITAAPTPAHRLASMPGPSARLLAAQTEARNDVNFHRTVCGMCKTGRARCPIGRELEIRMGHTDAAVRLAHEQHESALRAAAAAAISRTQQWRRVNPRVERTDARRIVPDGDAPTGAPAVPEEKLTPKR